MPTAAQQALTAKSSPEHPLPAKGIPTCQAEGCMSASLPQPDGNVEQPRLMCKYDAIHKIGNTYHVTMPPEQDRATVIGNMHKK